ncbi:hypothetical protein [Halomarina oriensis]|nr:hypothetical protein [Halomarina oriensis]
MPTSVDDSGEGASAGSRNALGSGEGEQFVEGFDGRAAFLRFPVE